MSQTESDTREVREIAILGARIEEIEKEIAEGERDSAEIWSTLNDLASEIKALRNLVGYADESLRRSA